MKNFSHACYIFFQVDFNEYHPYMCAPTQENTLNLKIPQLAEISWKCDAKIAPKSPGNFKPGEKSPGSFSASLNHTKFVNFSHLPQHSA